MSLGSSFVSSAKAVVRGAYVGLSMPTADLRPSPDFLLVGAQRCGTTSLFRALEQHQQVVRPTINKGINYFDVNYHRGERWYRAHFPLGVTSRRRTRAVGPAVTFEASGYYMFHPLAPERIAHDLPDVKIVAMLRDPVERAYSAWKHESARGFDPMSFEEAIVEEALRTAGEKERMVADPAYQGFAYRHHSYVARGHYAAQLRRFYDRFAASRIHVVYSESFFAEPAAEFALLADFLGIEPGVGLAFDQHNARPSGPMPGRTRQTLTQIYEAEADDLEQLVGRRPPWSAHTLDSSDS